MSDAVFGETPGEGAAVARNLSTRYLAIAAEAAVGLLILPFNVAHLGPAAYGLWTLTATIAAYFSVLDLGYAGALVKFVAEYRARRDVRALNEFLSTTFFVFAAAAVVICLVALGLAAFIDRFIQLSPDQVRVAQIVLLVTTVNVAAGTAFSVFGGVINGFQRYHVNNVVGTISGLVTAVVNVVVLLAGFGLIGLVISVTAVRLLTYWVYRANAYRVFPALKIRPRLFSRARFRQLTNLSVPMAAIDWAYRLNYSVDAIIIGAFMGTTAVAVWAIAQRLAELAQRLANQLNDILFPAFVEHDTNQRLDRLQSLFVHGTRLSLAAAIPLAGGLAIFSEPLIAAWVGAGFAESIPVLQILAFVVIVRVGNATAGVLLKGSGRPQFVAWVNLAAAACNVVISIAAVRRFGLRGVAIGTLIPVCVASMGILFPMACRRVQLPLRRVLAGAVWPALWPAAMVAPLVLALLRVPPDTLIGVGLQFSLVAAAYGAVFIFAAVSPLDRRSYFDKIGSLAPRLKMRPVSEGI